jgi:hypothetical protein
MSGQGYRNYQQFHNEVLTGRSGPLANPVEDMADEMYQSAHESSTESESLWDSVDDDE